MRVCDCPSCGCKKTMLYRASDVIGSCVSCGYIDNPFMKMLRETVAAPPIAIESPEYEQMFRRNVGMNNLASQYFCKKLNESTIAKNYLEKRKISEKSQKAFRLGYADGGLCDYLIKRGYTKTEIVNNGLGCSEDIECESIYDYFRRRIMFPITDYLGNIIGFGGRILFDDSNSIKYLNTKKTALFAKSTLFYGIQDFDWNSTDPVILCEGYMDVISMHQHGFRTALASMGTALTINHAVLLKQMFPTRQIICMYDSDGAGKKATEKNLKLLSEYGLDCRYITLSPQKDPDEFLQKHSADELREKFKQPMYDFQNFFSQNILEKPEAQLLHNFMKAKDVYASLKK